MRTNLHLKFIFFFIFLISKNIFAQNLIKNPSFELFSTCPNVNNLNGRITDWNGFSPGDASAFSTCGAVSDRVPDNSYGNQSPHTGNTYACIMVKNWEFDPNKRMYIQGTLSRTLLKDTIYCISYYVSLCDRALGAIQNIDLYLSDTLLDWNNGIAYTLLNISPQIKSKQIINDSLNWEKISGLYKAHGGESFVVIGNFLPNATCNYVSFSPGNPIRIDYYVDDVSVIPTSFQSPNLGADTILCRNNLPLTLSVPTGYDNYLWNTGSISNSIVVIDSGLYKVKCTALDCGEFSDSIHVSFYSDPILNLPEDTILCKGLSINISAQSGFVSYHWNTSDTSRTINVSDSGTYFVQAASNCRIQTDSINIAVDSLPDFIPNIGNDTTLCLKGVSTPIILSSKPH